MVCITYRFFPGQGAAGFVHSSGSFSLLNSSSGECLHTTGFCFGRLVSVGSSVLCGGGFMN